MVLIDERDQREIDRLAPEDDDNAPGTARRVEVGKHVN
jgi:hypothetical protein